MRVRSKSFSPFQRVVARMLALLLLVALGSCASTSPKWQPAPEFDEKFRAAGVEGVFVLHRLGSNEYRTNDPAAAQKRYLPASTFKIFNSLVALETGVIADEHEVFPWDGEARRVESWNRDHDLASAFRYSAVWYYQEIARRVGAEQMQYWIDRAGYGNQDIGGQPDLFWLKGNLRISPYEQVQLLERLYTNDLPFSQRSMDIVKSIMKIEETDGWRLSGKTGWGTADGEDVGWFVGFLERDDEVWLFANKITINRDEDARLRIEIARQILGLPTD